jgi:hypothetical protein
MMKLLCVVVTCFSFIALPAPFASADSISLDAVVGPLSSTTSDTDFVMGNDIAAEVAVVNGDAGVAISGNTSGINSGIHVAVVAGTTGYASGGFSLRSEAIAVGDPEFACPGETQLNCHLFVAILSVSGFAEDPVYYADQDYFFILNATTGTQGVTVKLPVGDTLDQSTLLYARHQCFGNGFCGGYISSSIGGGVALTSGLVNYSQTLAVSIKLPPHTTAIHMDGTPIAPTVVTPEPATMGLIATGLVGLAWRRGRRR